MDSAGTASSAMVLTIVAVGAAAGVSVRSDSEYVPPMRVVHREPPGPAQIELAESARASVRAPAPAPAPSEVALLGVDVASSTSDPCGDRSTSRTFTPVNVVCESIRVRTTSARWRLPAGTAPALIVGLDARCELSPHNRTWLFPRTVPKAAARLGTHT